MVATAIYSVIIIIVIVLKQINTKLDDDDECKNGEDENWRSRGADEAEWQRSSHGEASSSAPVSAVPPDTPAETDERRTVKWASAYGLSNNNNGDGGCGW